MSKIKYFDEIVDELTEEFGVNRRQIEEICKLNIKYIHKLTKNPNVISIQLPNLGVLYFNAGRAKHSYKNSSAYKKYLEIIGSQIDIVNDTKKDNKDLAHSRKSYYTIVRKYFFPKAEDRIKSSKTEVFKKLEEKQNRVIK